LVSQTSLDGWGSTRREIERARVRIATNPGAPGSASAPPPNDAVPRAGTRPRIPLRDNQILKRRESCVVRLNDSAGIETSWFVALFIGSPRLIKGRIDGAPPPRPSPARLPCRLQNLLSTLNGVAKRPLSPNMEKTSVSPLHAPPPPETPISQWQTRRRPDGNPAFVTNPLRSPGGSAPHTMTEPAYLPAPPPSCDQVVDIECDLSGQTLKWPCTDCTRRRSHRASEARLRRTDRDRPLLRPARNTQVSLILT